MDVIGSKIRRLREEKGLTQEYMAAQMELSQSNYGRLEKDDRRLTAHKLQIIAGILDVTIASLFNEQTSKIINQSNNPQAYNVENYYQNSREVYENFISSQKQEIEYLKEQIEFLKELLNK